MLLQCLALWHDIQTTVWQMWEETKHGLRDWLGPAPRKWYLVEDQITHISVPESLVFCPVQNHLYKETDFQERGKRLPWLAITLQMGETNWDISDWISSIRIHPECPMPSLLQMIRLASRVHHVFLSETATRVHLTNRNGEDEVYAFKGAVTLEKE